MHILIFTGGRISAGKCLSDVLKKADKIFAADSGASIAIKSGVLPSLVIGDFDSLDKNTLSILKTKNVKILKFTKNKNETDTELAINEAIKYGATKISIAGGIEGNRIDHILANIFLLTLYDLPINFVNGSQIIWMEKGPATLIFNGNPGDLLSLLPTYGNVTGIITQGLQYKLRNEMLIFGKTRGISNVFTENKARVKFSNGNLLIVYTHIEL